MGNLPKSACHRCWDGEVGTVLRQLDLLYYFLAHPKTDDSNTHAPVNGVPS
jgi:hypothetical protein